MHSTLMWSLSAALLMVSGVDAAESPSETVRVVVDGVRHIERKYGEWTTLKIVDPLEPKFMILLCSPLLDVGYSRDTPRMCFRFFSENIVVFEPQGLLGKGYWPYCDYDNSTYKIGDGAPEYVPMSTARGGSCGDRLDTSDEKFFQRMKGGGEMQLKIGTNRGKVNLSGFAEALDYATSEFK